jgi:parallel beta-helix repeat protein
VGIAVVASNRTTVQGNVVRYNGAEGVKITDLAGNTIGGLSAGQANTIALNGGGGIVVQGISATGNVIRANSIYSNASIGVDNVNGGNLERSPPVVVDANAVSGNSTCPAVCKVDVYSDSEDEGRTWEGWTTVVDGQWSFEGTVRGPNVTASVTDVDGNTSEFSAPRACVDSPDGDAICNSGDPDDDNDGWSDVAEYSMGTNPVVACGINAWPPDINSDGLVDMIGDVVPLVGQYGRSVPPGPTRYDTAPDPPDRLIDIFDIVRMAGFFSQHC